MTCPHTSPRTSIGIQLVPAGDGEPAGLLHLANCTCRSTLGTPIPLSPRAAELLGIAIDMYDAHDVDLDAHALRQWASLQAVIARVLGRWADVLAYRELRQAVAAEVVS